MTSEALKQSLASWREAHGFGILCINSPMGEHFVVVPADEARVAADQAEHGFGAWAGISEAQLRQYLEERGLSAVDTEDAIELARAWGTTITGSGALASPHRSI